MKATNKIHKITLVSHYFNQTLNLRLNSKQFEILEKRLRQGFELTEIVSDDNDRFHHGYYPIVFSRRQLLKINKCPGNDYYKTVENV